MYYNELWEKWWFMSLKSLRDRFRVKKNKFVLLYNIFDWRRDNTNMIEIHSATAVNFSQDGFLFEMCSRTYYMVQTVVIRRLPNSIHRVRNVNITAYINGRFVLCSGAGIALLTWIKY